MRGGNPSAVAAPAPASSKRGVAFSPCDAYTIIVEAEGSGLPVSLLEDQRMMKRAENGGIRYVDMDAFFESERKGIRAVARREARRRARIMRYDVAPEESRETPQGVIPDAPKKDKWVLGEGTVTRVHVRPRRALFTPVNTGCPVNPDRLSGKRVTSIKALGGGTSTKATDDWTVWAGAHRDGIDEGQQWTGETTFTITPTEDAVEPRFEDLRPAEEVPKVETQLRRDNKETMTSSTRRSKSCGPKECSTRQCPVPSRARSSFGWWIQDVVMTWFPSRRPG